jgi:aerobic-type carbon monoxide dehydrogenase small subunit (CoxS/CutS family)
MIHLTVNGQDRALDINPHTPLLWALRDHLGLVGTKFGCGIAVCGACTVHVDGEAVRSCSVPIATLAGSKITTIEGLAALSGHDFHPVQTAWIENDVPQCGYCQAGQIMSAVALLAKIPHPTDEQIDESMSGNLCRCCTYVRIRAGIHRAAEIAAGSAAKPA